MCSGLKTYFNDAIFAKYVVGASECVVKKRIFNQVRARSLLTTGAYQQNMIKAYTRSTSTTVVKCQNIKNGLEQQPEPPTHTPKQPHLQYYLLRQCELSGHFLALLF